MITGRSPRGRRKLTTIQKVGSSGGTGDEMKKICTTLPPRSVRATKDGTSSLGNIDQRIHYLCTVTQPRVIRKRVANKECGPGRHLPPEITKTIRRQRSSHISNCKGAYNDGESHPSGIITSFGSECNLAGFWVDATAVFLQHSGTALAYVHPC